MEKKSDAPPPPPLSHVLEFVVYVKNKDKSELFYKDLFGIEPFVSSPRSSGFAIGNTVLLLFQQGLTEEDQDLDIGLIPGHGPSVDILRLLKGSNAQASQRLKHHFCFAVRERHEVETYEARLKGRGIEITGIVNWERGGRSVYFSDPDGSVVEIASRGLWPNW